MYNAIPKIHSLNIKFQRDHSLGLSSWLVVLSMLAKPLTPAEHISEPAHNISWVPQHLLLQWDYSSQTDVVLATSLTVFNELPASDDQPVLTLTLIDIYIDHQSSLHQPASVVSFSPNHRRQELRNQSHHTRASARHYQSFGIYQYNHFQARHLLAVVANIGDK